MPLGLAWPRRAVSRQVQGTLFCPSPSFRQTPAWTQALGLLGFERLRRCEQLHHSRGCHAQHSPHKMRMHRSTTCTICAIPFKPRDASCAAFTMHCNACSLATRHWLSQTIPVVTHCAGRARGVPARNTRRASRCGASGARLWPLQPRLWSASTSLPQLHWDLFNPPLPYLHRDCGLTAATSAPGLGCGD